MGEEKFASLSSGLLARKGAAKPAMRRQGFINPQGDVTEDLGWNDMGLEAPQPVNGDGHHGEAPLPEVRKQRQELEKGLNESSEESVETEDGEYPDIADHMVEHHAFEPYESNGKTGLTPMEPDEAEGDRREEDDIQSVDDGQAVGEETQEAEIAAEAPDGVVPHGESPLSSKSTAPVAAQTPEGEQPKPGRKPEADKIPAREKVAFTLRLDKERHLKLRLASAITNQSAQRLVTEALDRFLEEHPDVQSIAGQSADGKTH